MLCICRVSVGNLLLQTDLKFSFDLLDAAMGRPLPTADVPWWLSFWYSRWISTEQTGPSQGIPWQGQATHSQEEADSTGPSERGAQPKHTGSQGDTVWLNDDPGVPTKPIECSHIGMLIVVYAHAGHLTSCKQLNFIHVCPWVCVCTQYLLKIKDGTILRLNGVFLYNPEFSSTH